MKKQIGYYLASAYGTSLVVWLCQANLLSIWIA